MQTHDTDDDDEEEEGEINEDEGESKEGSENDNNVPSPNLNKELSNSSKRQFGIVGTVPSNDQTKRRKKL